MVTNNQQMSDEHRACELPRGWELPPGRAPRQSRTRVCRVPVPKAITLGTLSRETVTGEQVRDLLPQIPLMFQMPDGRGLCPWKEPRGESMGKRRGGRRRKRGQERENWFIVPTGDTAVIHYVVPKGRASCRLYFL